MTDLEMRRKSSDLQSMCYAAVLSIHQDGHWRDREREAPKNPLMAIERCLDVECCRIRWVDTSRVDTLGVRQRPVAAEDKP